MLKWLLLVVLVAGLLGFGLIQLIPYGRDLENPPVIQEPAWPDAETRVLAQRACFDCHSNEAVWPWYSRIAPVSWLVQKDVEEGREELNFSEWGHGDQDVDDLEEVIREGEMPPLKYLLAHPSAWLSDAEKDKLASGLAAIGGREPDDD